MRRIPVFALVVTIVTGTCALAGEKPEKTIKLFNGQDLSNWTWHTLAEDAPLEDTWSVENGLLVCKGRPNGYIRTKDEYENYRLTLEWRWPEGSRPGNNGVLIHTTTPRELGVWPKSLEVQLAHENAGDFWVIGTTVEIPDADRRVMGRRHLKLVDGAEKPAGEWNKMEIVARGDTVAVRVNGRLVNEASRLSQSKGAVSLQSEGALIHFRNIELTPLETDSR